MESGKKAGKDRTSAAYDELIRREILAITPYVPGKPVEEVQRELGISDVIKLASNENPLGPAPRAIEAIRDAAAGIHIYPDGNCYYLKEALSEKLGVSPAHLVIGNGSDEVIKLLAEAFFQPGDEVVTAEPTFGEYAYAARLMGAKLVTVKAREGLGHDLERMAEAVTEKTKAVFVCNPNNPTGTMNTKKEWENFLDRIPPHVLVVVDQAYLEYVENPEYPDGLAYLDSGKKLLVLRTFSKIYGLAGLRVGYGVAPPDLAACLNRVREPFNVNLLAQIAAKAALDDEEFLARSREVNREGKKQLGQGLAELGLEYLPSETNFLFFVTPFHSKEVFRRLLTKGVIVRSGDIFNQPHYIRVTVGTAEQNTRFLRALQETLAELG